MMGMSTVQHTSLLTMEQSPHKPLDMTKSILGIVEGILRKELANFAFLMASSAKTVSILNIQHT